MDHHPACCPPTFGMRSPKADASSFQRGAHTVAQAHVPEGRFLMGDGFGDGRAADGESLEHWFEIDASSIDDSSVTSRDFASFVVQTGFVTEAESFDYSAVFHLALAA